MNLRAQTPRKPIGLTPMIDVVFLLLVFFMLAARFTVEGAIDVPLASTGAEFGDTPRLIDVDPETLRLNGVATSLEELPRAVSRLLASPSDAVVLRGSDVTSVQRLVGVLQVLTTAGFSNVVIIE